MTKRRHTENIKCGSSEKFFRKYLLLAPLSVALCRSIEAKHFASVIMKEPVLDIGCGFAEFGQVFFDKPTAMGVDNAPLDLFAAAKTKVYKNLLLADARDLPLQKESYATVMSVSTLEHITHADKVIREAYRVLKKKGQLVITVETTLVDQHTFYRPLLKKVGLTFISNALTKWFNRVFHRHLLLSKDEWERLIRKSGFVIKHSRLIVSPTVIKLFDLFIVTAWPAQLLRFLIGRRIVYRPKFVVDLLTKIFLKYVDDETSGGTVLFVVAEKPGKNSLDA